MSTTIYRLTPSPEEDRPDIDTELPVNGENVNWLAVGEVLDGDRDALDWPSVAIFVNHRDATDWDCYAMDGTTGMYSKRAIDAMGPALNDFRLFPVTLNGMPYYFLRCEHKLNCFDRERSVWTPIPGTTDRVFEIKKYVFFHERIKDPLVFCIPDRRNRLFATQSVVNWLRHAGCQGIDMQQLT